MKVIITRGHCLGAGVDVYPGDVVDLPDRVAALKIQQGKARLCEPDPTPVRIDPETIHNDDPVPKHRDPKPGPKRSRK